MSIRTLADARRPQVRLRLQRVTRTALRDPIGVLRLRLAGRRLAGRLASRRVAGRASALERVMRRTAFHSSRFFTARLTLQALTGHTTVRELHTLPMRAAGIQAVPVHPLPRQDRTRVFERVLHQRLVERLAHRQVAAAAPRVSFVTRVEHRHAAPRIQMTMVRTQAAAAQAASAASSDLVHGAARERPGAAPPRIAQAAPAPALPPQELSRLTDHVIRQLDRRVLSWQERTGRI